ncbi:hypothetical protein ACFE33_12380 [Falsihalocynthiibacter sp. SS001]|uniref:hypothetical protein n=1 Tax=Falsihalocynthiibacter sp. SS001 TaxID=3349698 RepID=UPI0036D3BEA1
MADGTVEFGASLSGATTLEQLKQLIEAAQEGAVVEGLTLIDADGRARVAIPSDTSFSHLAIIGDDIILLQPDGTIIVLVDAVLENYLLVGDAFAIPTESVAEAANTETSWDELADIEPIEDLDWLLDSKPPNPGSVDKPIVVIDPLIGLPFSPLLPPTEYPRPERDDEEYGGATGIVVNPIMEGGDVDLVETDGTLVINLSEFYQIAPDVGGASTLSLLDVHVVLVGLPPGTTATAGTFTEAEDGTLTFEYMGTAADYPSLTLTIPKDFSTDNRTAPGTDGPEAAITGTITSQSNTGGTEVGSLDVSITIGTEGDAEIDSSMPYADLIEDQLDPDSAGDAFPILPVELLAPKLTDDDGSETLTQAVLVVEGLPATDRNGVPLADPIDGTYLDLQVDPGADVVFARAADGSITMTITLDAAGVGDVLGAYEAIQFSVPPDFSTANRSDLTGGETALPITFSLTIISDEDQNGVDDGPNDGVDSATRVLNIDFVEDIDLTAPSKIEVLEDGGPLSQIGTIVRLGVDVVTQADIDAGNTGIDTSIGDIDGSETDVPGNDPFTAVVTIEYSRSLPDGTVFNGGTYDPNTLVWTGTVAEANALIMEFAPDVNGTVETVITVTTREGQEVTQQTIEIFPTPDAKVVGNVVTDETDADVVILFSDYLEFVDADSRETVDSAVIVIPGLPAGTTSNTGSFSAPDADGLVTWTYNYPTDAVAPPDVTLTFEKDFSTESTINPPPGEFTALVELTIDPNTGEPMVTGDSTFTITINDEGDPLVEDGAMDISETDAPLIFKPSDTASGGVVPEITDMDGSESFTGIDVAFANLPAGALYSIVASPTDADFQTVPAGGLTGLTLAQYQDLSLKLPTDFSTTNPASAPIEITITATTDEGDATTNTDSGTITVTITAEGDILAEAGGTIALDENDAPGDTDDDNTTSDPVEFRMTDAAIADPTDLDGSESIETVIVSFDNLPAGSQISTDNGNSFSPANAASYSLTGAEYEATIIRLPDDYSTTDGDLTGSVTFITDEDQNGVDDGPNDGVAVIDFTVTVAPEADIAITTADITEVEDYVAAPPDGQGETIPLGMDIEITDIDGSETLETIEVTFEGLPDTGTTITTSSGEQDLTGPSQTISVTLAELQSMAITSLPTHFSGRIVVTVEATSNEGGPDSSTFNVDITPIAEPTIDLSVVENAPTVTEIDNGDPDLENFIVKEDNNFTLTFDASTPDQDGSEELTQIVIENVPEGWTTPADGDISGSLTGDPGQLALIDTSTVSGTTITITLVAGVTSVAAGITLTPLADDDRDVATIVGDEITATVTSVDTADSIPDTDTNTASDIVDMDVDAVVDAASGNTDDVNSKENTEGRRNVALNFNEIALSDNDGSETITSLELTIAIDTASDVFDPMNSDDMRLFVTSDYEAFITIVGPIDNGDDTVSYAINIAAGTTQEEFTTALESLKLSFPQHFSGEASISGDLIWGETTTPDTYPGDVEVDLTDNNSLDVGGINTSFTTMVIVAAVAEAELGASVFVLNDNEVDGNSPTSISATANEDDPLSTAVDVLRLLESTDDGSSDAGQVELYVGISASTPDLDGSEELESIIVRNIPTDWIADYVTGGDVDRAAFFSADGTSPISDEQWDKIESATYDDATGELTITFLRDETDFEGSIQLQPTLYEDYDVNPEGDYDWQGLGYTAEGEFFDGELTVALTTRDYTTEGTLATETPDDEVVVEAEFDVDVEPVNNLAYIPAVPIGNEQEIDDAGGVWTVSLFPEINDMDGSEKVTAVVLRNVPQGITIYVPEDVNNPTGPKVPALITALNEPDGFNVWSLEAGQWEFIEIRGVPTHFSGSVAEPVDVVTTETDGGDTRITQLDLRLYVAPVTDGGDPSETGSTNEDTPVHVVIDGNIIDNESNSPRSPEAIEYPITITVADGDEFAGEGPRFFYDTTGAGFDVDTFDPDNPPAGVTELLMSGGSIELTDEDMAQNLWVLPRLDGNNTLTLDVEVTYFETVDPLNLSTPIVATGQITIDVKGIADPAEVYAQEDDPTAAGSSLTDGDVDAVYKVDPSYSFDQVYGYAGYYGNPGFELNQKLTDAAIQNGFTAPDDSIFEAVDPLSGMMTEIQDGADYDGSETIYYIIDGVPSGGYFAGAQQIADDGGTYLVTQDQLDNLVFVAPDVSEVEFYELTLYGIVYEDDQEVIEISGGDIAANLAAIDAEPGAAVTEQTFTIIVLPDPGGDPTNCDPIPAPTLTFDGEDETLEDEGIVLRPVLTPDGDYSSLDDLMNLPDGRIGSVTISIDLPEGATISSDPAGAVYLDPTSGEWIIDIAKLGIDGTTTTGSITITPPPHQSSPANPFDPAETIGPNDTYDSLDQIDFSMTVNNIGCGTVETTTSSFDLNIVPVVDGPIIVITGDDTFKEDTQYELGIELNNSLIDEAGGMDGGERLTGNVVISITGGDSSAVQLFLADGTSVPNDGSGTFTVAPADISGLYILPPLNYGGGYLTIEVTATTQDINGDTASNTSSTQVYVDAVADIPQLVVDQSVIDPDTGNPYVDISSGTPILQIIEDIPFSTFPALNPTGGDTDGSETISIVVDLTQADGLILTGPSGSGFIDNGNGTYTISESAFASVMVVLEPEHARTPDEINTDIPSEFVVGISIQTLEIDFIDSLEDQSDNEADFQQDIIVRVRPDADDPTLTATADPSTGVEDDPVGVELTISGTTPDPHENMRFDITLPTDAGGNPVGQILLDGVPVDAVGGVVSIPADGRGGPGVTLTPSGTVTYLPPTDFAGDVSLSIVAVSIDSTEPGALFVDEEVSEPIQIDLTITVSPDLDFSIDNSAVQLTETDAALVYAPSDDITVEVTDVDGSEVGTVTYTLTGVPDGTTWTSGDGSGTASGGVLTYTGSDTDFQTLTVTFPADFATNGTPLNGEIQVITNEGADEGGTFTVEVAGELDVEVTSTSPIIVTRGLGAEEVEFGIDASIVPATNEWETLEEVVIDFDQALPIGTRTPNGGTLNDERTQLTLSRNGTDPVAFAAAIAALSVAIPLNRAEDFTGTVTVTSTHGTAAPVPFEVQFQDPAPTATLLSFRAFSPPLQDEFEEESVPDNTLAVANQDIGEDGSHEPEILQMETVRTDESERQVMSEVTSESRGETIARATEQGDVVIVDADSTYQGVDGFEMLGGDDLVDLSAASRGFSVDGGAGNDIIIGSAYSDTMTGGEGADIFVMAGLTLADVITDYEGPDAPDGGDAIDLSALIDINEEETVADHVNYDASSGALDVDGQLVATVNTSTGAFADQVEILFEDAQAQQASVII